jgi:hypothetical protein
VGFDETFLGIDVSIYLMFTKCIIAVENCVYYEKKNVDYVALHTMRYAR